MAVVYITEYAALAQDALSRFTSAPKEPPVTTQTVAIGGVSAQSAAFNAGTRFVRVHTDAICSVLVGDNPTAAATSPRLAANSTEYFGVTPGQKIAVITNV